MKVDVLSHIRKLTCEGPPENERCCSAFLSCHQKCCRMKAFEATRFYSRGAVNQGPGREIFCCAGLAGVTEGWKGGGIGNSCEM